jgi:hypothetical protein
MVPPPSLASLPPLLVDCSPLRGRVLLCAVVCCCVLLCAVVCSFSCTALPQDLDVWGEKAAKPSAGGGGDDDGSDSDGGGASGRRGSTASVGGLALAPAPVPVRTAPPVVEETDLLGLGGGSRYHSCAV